MTERLLEREAYLDQLGRWARESRATGRLVLIGGEAGIGKSSLVRAFARSSGPAMRTLIGACEPLTTPRPLAPLLDIAATEPRIASLIAERAVPTLLFGALLETLRSRPGSLLVMEDVHWADDATLDLLRFLGRRLTDVPALVLATYRADELGGGHPLRVLMGDLATAPALRRLSVAPLSRAAVEVLALGADVDADVLWRRTGGNPFFVTEVLATRGETVPESAQDAVLARAARLPRAARELLDVVAVLDAAADLPTLGEVVGPLGGALNRCVESGLLVMDAGRVTFRHELARIAILSAIPAERRVDLHRAALHALEAAEAAAPAVLSHHAEGAGDRCRTRYWAERAATEASRVGAHREAAAHLGQVLRALPAADRRQRAAVLLRCSRECAHCDRIAEATAEAEEALRIWRAVADQLSEGDTLAWLARLAWTSDRIAQAVDLARSATALLGRLPPSIELVCAQATLARLLSLHYAHPEAAECAREAERLAAHLGDEEQATQTKIDLGTVLALRGDPSGRPLIDRAIAQARAIGAHEQAAYGMFNLVRLASGASRHEELDGLAAAARAFCIEHGFAIWEDYARAVEAQALLHRGRWCEAATTLTDLWRSTTQASPTSRVAIVCTTLGLLRARRGDPDPDGLLQVAAERLDRAPLVGPVLELAAAHAEQAWITGRLRPLGPRLRTLVKLARVRDGWWVDELRWWLAVAEGRGGQEWRAAAQRWAERDHPYHRALALAESSEEKPLREALAITRDLHAWPLARLLTRRLRVLGARDLPHVRTTRARIGPLTPREHDVLALLAEGLRDAEIAARLHLSERTVNHHVSAVLQKLTAPSRTAAVAQAVRNGLIAQT